MSAPYSTKVDLAGDDSGVDVDVSFLDEHHRVVLVDGVAQRDSDEAHDAAHVSRDLVLHFHGFHHHDELARRDLVALLDRDRDNGSLQGCRERCAAVWPNGGCRSDRCCSHWGRRTTALAIIEYREGILTDPDSRKARTASRGRGSGEVPLFEIVGGISEGRSVLSNEPCGDLVRLHLRPIQQRLQIAKIGRNTLDAEFSERSPSAANGVCKIGARGMANDLGK
jgi:hypothetical protein